MRFTKSGFFWPSNLGVLLLVLANVGSIIVLWLVDWGFLGCLEGPMKVALIDLHHCVIKGCTQYSLDKPLSIFDR